jgi:hypothetical protein
MIAGQGTLDQLPAFSHTGKGSVENSLFMHIYVSVACVCRYKVTTFTGRQPMAKKAKARRTWTAEQVCDLNKGFERLLSEVKGTASQPTLACF